MKASGNAVSTCLLVALPCLALAACTACSDGPGVVAGTDASTADAVSERRPTPSDSGKLDVDLVPDVPTDANPFSDWFPGEWQRTPNVPAGCYSIIATHPERDVPPITWEPCSPAQAACEQSAVTWTTLPGDALRADEKVRLGPGGTPMLSLKRLQIRTGSSSNFDAVYTAALELNGPVHAATGMRTTVNSSCIDAALRPTESGIAHAILLSSPPTAMRYRTRKYREDVWIEHDLSYAAVGGEFGTTNQGASAALVQTASFKSAILDLYSGQVVLPQSGGQRMMFSLAEPAGGGFWSRSPTPGAGGYIFLRNDGSFERVPLEPIAPWQVVLHAVDRTQGDAFVWVEADNVDKVLWTSPFASNAAQVQRRRVTRGVPVDFSNSSNYLIAANGVAVLNDKNRPTATLIRLSDGQRWQATAPTNTAFIRPVWVDDTYLYMLGGPLERAVASPFAYSRHIYRIERSSLGPGTPPT
jgi:hypothetical protein